MNPIVLGVGPFDVEVLLPFIIALSGIATGVLAVVGLVALSRRRSPPYFLVAVALTMLAVRAVVGLLAFAGLMDVGLHNFVEHGLDFVIAVLLIAAIFEARTPNRCSFGSTPEGQSE